MIEKKNKYMSDGWTLNDRVPTNKEYTMFKDLIVERKTI